MAEDHMALVERLRTLHIIDEVQSDNRLGQEAADALEAQALEVERLTEITEALRDTDQLQNVVNALNAPLISNRKRAEAAEARVEELEAVFHEEVECTSQQMMAKAKAQAEAAQMRVALAFAQSVIKCAEPWTDKCEEIIGQALATDAGKAVAEVVKAAQDVFGPGGSIKPYALEELEKHLANLSGEKQ